MTAKLKRGITKVKDPGSALTPVSYTHLDVYKRQFREAAKASYEQLGLTDTYNEIMSALGK